MNYAIDSMQTKDWPQVRAIYQEGIATGQATFETNAPDWDQWNAGHLPVCRLVARDREKIMGWAALSSVSRRQAYSGVAEASIYVAAEARRQGLGVRLMVELIAASEANGIWTLQSSIFPENQASVALHLKYGFREVGKRQRIAKLQGHWRNTVLLERRSQIVGTD
ncbi:MAG: N-acetyltransferase family protein [Acidobacteriota bacterium]|nr:N-acetyltransferase family protein [Acidobacteriota bacterium]